MSKVRTLEPRHKVAPALDTPTDLSPEAVKAISGQLNAILADSFALYLKTKNFHCTSAVRTSATITCCSTSRRRISSRPPTNSPSACARSAA